MISNIQFGALMVREKSIREHGVKEHVGQYRIARRKEADAIKLLEEAGIDIQISGIQGARLEDGQLIPDPTDNGIAVQYIDRETRNELRGDVYDKDRDPREVLLMALGTAMNLFILKGAQVTEKPNTFDFENGKGKQVHKIDSRGRGRFAPVEESDLPERGLIAPIRGDEPTFHSPSDGRIGLIRS